jgi:hypothetical protein
VGYVLGYAAPAKHSDKPVKSSIKPNFDFLHATPTIRGVALSESLKAVRLSGA